MDVVEKSTLTTFPHNYCDDSDNWSFGGGCGSEDSGDPWSAFIDAMSKRYTELQNETRLIDETRYIIVSEEDKDTSMELIVGLSGALDFTPALKINSSDVVIPFAHMEWIEFSSCLKVISEEYFENKQEIDLILFDSLFVRSLIVDNKPYISMSRCGAVIYLDKSIVQEMLNKNCMVCYRLDILYKLDFYHYFKKILNLVERIAFDLNYEKSYEDILLILFNIPDSEHIYCMIECLCYMKHHVFSYLDSIKVH